jgi:hypothetical protein
MSKMIHYPSLDVHKENIAVAIAAHPACDPSPAEAFFGEARSSESNPNGIRDEEGFLRGERFLRRSVAPLRCFLKRVE